MVEVGARTRTIPPALRRALAHRDQTCRFPGCRGQIREGHHVQHWARGGPTALSNLVSLCRRHHRAVHEELGLPEPLIVRLLEAGAPDEQLPVLGHLARELGQTPERIFELHRSGLSFLDISLRFGRGPEIFYVPLAVDPGPPYGKAWGYYKKTPRARWNRKTSTAT